MNILILIAFFLVFAIGYCHKQIKRDKDQHNKMLANVARNLCVLLLVIDLAVIYWFSGVAA